MSKHSKLPIFELFLSVGNLKPKLKWFFKPKLKPKFSIELGPSPPLASMYGHMDVPTATTKKEEEAAATHSFPDNPPPSDASGTPISPHPPIPDVMVNPESYRKLLREVSDASFLSSPPETTNRELLETLTLDQLTNPRNASAMPVSPKLLGVILNTKNQSNTSGSPNHISPQPTASPPLVSSSTSPVPVESFMPKSEQGTQHRRPSSNKNTKIK